MSDNIRLLIADDHHVVRGGLRALLETEDGIEVIDEAADGVEAVLKTRSLAPDVILLDLVMPRKTGVEAIEDIKEENPNSAQQSWYYKLLETERLERCFVQR